VATSWVTIVAAPGSSRVAIVEPRLTLTMTITAAEPHVQVFATDDAVCVEPQTCPPDAFGLAARGLPGTGLAIVEPGRPLQLGCRWTWELRGPP